MEIKVLPFKFEHHQGKHVLLIANSPLDAEWVVMICVLHVMPLVFVQCKKIKIIKKREE